MKLSEIIRTTGQPFAYYPELVRKHDISVNACVLYCFIAWKTLPHAIGEWIPLTIEVIKRETGLTEKEQINARKVLVEKRMIEEHYARLEHTLKFRLADLEIEVSPSAEREDAPPEHPPKGRMAIHPKGVSTKDGKEGLKKEEKEVATLPLFPQKPSLKAKKKYDYEIPKNLNDPRFLTMWDAWLADRKERKKPVTKRGAEMQLRKLSEMGPERAAAAIENSIEKGYQGIFEASKGKVSKTEGMFDEDISYNSDGTSKY